MSLSYEYGKSELPKKRYVFALMRKGVPYALYIGDKQLPEEVVKHEFSHRQMKQILLDYGYKLMTYR